MTHVETAGTGGDRSRPRRPREPSHAEICNRLEEAAAEAERMARAAKEASDLQALALQRVEEKIDKALRVLGGEGEDERGTPIGTGIAGRVMRLEQRVAKRFRLYDDLRHYTLGFVAALTLLIGVLWWLLGPRLDLLLRR